MAYRVYIQKDIIVAAIPEAKPVLTTIPEFKGTVNAPINVSNQIITLSASQIDELKEGALSFIEEGTDLFFHVGWYEIDGAGIKENTELKNSILSGDYASAGLQVWNGTKLVNLDTMDGSTPAKTLTTKNTAGGGGGSVPSWVEFAENSLGRRLTIRSADDPQNAFIELNMENDDDANSGAILNLVGYDGVSTLKSDKALGTTIDGYRIGEYYVSKFDVLGKPAGSNIWIYSFKKGGNDSLGTHQKLANFTPDPRYEVIIPKEYIGTLLRSDVAYDSPESCLSTIKEWAISQGVITKNFDITHWKTTLAQQVEVKKNTELNLFSIISNGDKLPVSTGAGNGKMDIANNGIKTTWFETLETLDFRMNGELSVGGGTKHFGVELRRVVDDSVVVSGTIAFKNDTTEDKWEVDFPSYVASDTDPFVVDGFYIAFVNQSGADINLKGDIGLLITRTYQQARNI